MAKRRNSIFTLILLSMIVIGSIYLQPVKSQYNGYNSYTINSDGTITPATVPIQWIGNTYTLTGDIRGSVTIERSDIILG